MRILVLGGGYVAIHLCRRIRRAIGRREVEVTVVSRDNFHIWHGFIGEMLAGLITPSHILSPARRLVAPARLEVADIEEVDLENRRVRTCHEGQDHHLEYDHLVVSLGTRQDLAAWPGLAEHGFMLKSWDDCSHLRNHLQSMFEQASLCRDPEKRRAMLTFLVAGGGFSGAEIAGNLADQVNLFLRRDFGHLDRSEVRVILVHPGKTLLPELYGERVDERQFKQYPRLVDYAARHLRKLGVEIRFESRVEAVSRNMVVLPGGERIAARTIISAVGTCPHALVAALPLPKDKAGRIVTDRFCRVEGFENVWAGGDCAAVPHPRGGACPPTAIWAMKAGDRLGDNLLNTARGRALRPFDFSGLGQAVSIGGHTAVAELHGIELKGTLAWLVWRGFLFYYFPSWERKLKILVDWLLHPLFGSDIVEMSVRDSDDFTIHYVRFQPGETVVEQGGVGRSLYLIAEGEVEVLRDVDHDGIPDIMQVVGPGGYIGHDVQDGVARHTARTRTHVRAVEIRIEEAERLREVLHLLQSALPAPR